MSVPTDIPTPVPSDEERCRALADLSPDILSIFDLQGRLVYSSAAVSRVHGYNVDELIGRSTFDHIHPEDRANVEAAFAAVIAHPDRQGLVRYRYRNADGSYTWMEATGRNEVANPALGGIIAISRDISAQFAAEQALREAERRFRMLFAANPQPMTIFDLETLQFLEANETALALYGYAREEFLGLRSSAIRPEEDLPRFERVLEQLRDDRRTGQVEHRARHRTKDGRIVDVVALVRRLDWVGRPACLVLIQDVTEQLRLQTKLQQTQKLESLGLLAGGIAHDFNNLLTAILGQSSMVAQDLPDDSPARANVLLIQESAVRAADLCRQMLAYSGRGRFLIRAIDLSALLRSTVELLKVTLRHTTVLHLDLAADLPAVEGDPSQLQQVAMNLVLNAADAIGEQGGAIHLATRLEHADRALLETMYLAPDLPPGDYVRLEVVDTGCGMSPEVLARVFDPFFTTKFTGRGLGLAAVLGIVRGHRGAIRVGSTPGVGTAFTLLFPVAPRPASPLPSPARSAGPAPVQPERTILVVDDDESVRRTVKAMLQRHGMRTLFAEDGLTGVELFAARHQEIDAVLLDLTMPRLDGTGALRRMLEIQPDARILLMSGFDEAAESERYGQLGQAGFVQKPFTMQALVDKLVRACAPPVTGR